LALNALARATLITVWKNIFLLFRYKLANASNSLRVSET